MTRRRREIVSAAAYTVLDWARSRLVSPGEDDDLVGQAFSELRALGALRLKWVDSEPVFEITDLGRAIWYAGPQPLEIRA